jgi:hypothetical protein
MMDQEVAVRRSLLLMAALFALPLLAAGCETHEDHLALATVDHNPLAFDPTEPYELGPWWSNGAQLLRLDEVGAYALYDPPNRYRAPVERGSWIKHSYAEIRFGPYDVLRTQWERVEVSKIDGRLALTVDGFEPMFAVGAPPRVPEDDLLGPWRSDVATLVISPNRRYALSSNSARVDDLRAPAVVAGHRGVWRLDGDRLRLDPDPPALGPFELRRSGGDDDVVLTSSGDVYRRVVRDEETENAS